MYTPQQDDDIVHAVRSYVEAIGEAGENAADVAMHLRAFADLMRCSALYGRPITYSEIRKMAVGTHVVVFDPRSLTTHVSAVTEETVKADVSQVKEVGGIVSLQALKGYRENVFAYQVFQCGGRKCTS